MEQAQDIRKIVGPEGCGDHLSFGGQTFEADEKGIFEVPPAAANELAAHGFKAAPVATESQPPQQQGGNGAQTGQAAAQNAGQDNAPWVKK